MKKILSILLLSLVTCCAYSQEKFDVKLINDTVYNFGKAIYTCKGQIKWPKSFYTLRTFDNKILAFISFEDVDTLLKTIVTFPTINVRYGTLYPKADVTVLLESLFRNRVILNNAVDSVGLNYYCKVRDIEIKKIEVKRAVRPYPTDSASIAKAKLDFESQIKFVLVNASTLQVSVKIGSSSNNRIQLIPPGGTINERAHVGEQVCLVDKNRIPVTCKTVRASDKKFTVNADATGFE